MYSCNILILTNWAFDDALIQAYTLPYVRMIRHYLSSGKDVWFQTLEKERVKEKHDSINATLNESNINWLPDLYHGYGWRSWFSMIAQLIKLYLFCRTKKIKVIHIWCTPPGIIGYFLSILTGAELIIDSYEPHAEAMVENGSWKRNGIKHRVLFFFEKLMSRRAKVIISATRGMRDYAQLKYGVSFDQFFVKPACVDLGLFDLQRRKNVQLAQMLGLNEKIVMVYAGKFGGIYLDKEIFDLIKIFYDFYGDRFRFLLLTSHNKKEIEGFRAAVGLPSEIVVLRFVRHSEIPDYMGLADFAITPVRPVPTKLYCTPVKDGEYWALGLPIIITKDISDDSAIIKNEKIGVVLETLDQTGYRSALNQIDALLGTDRTELRKKIRAVAVKYRSFDIADKIYSQLYH